MGRQRDELDAQMRNPVDVTAAFRAACGGRRGDGCGATSDRPADERDRQMADDIELPQ